MVKQDEHAVRDSDGRTRLAKGVRGVVLGAVALATVAALVAPGRVGLAIQKAGGARLTGLGAYRPASTHRRALPAGGTAAIGALFTVASGGRGVGTHFCTASVVDSPAGDLVMTAAHCVSGLAPRQFDFVPGYHNGRAPFGVWRVTRVIVNEYWSSSANPDDDVAFLIVCRPGSTTGVQALTGAERLGTGQPARQLVRVIGYPDNAGAPISCLSRVHLFSPTQLEFDCGGYTSGTSGSPLLADISPVTGLGTVVGVIGGYQQSGTRASVSHAGRLGGNTPALYRTAIAGP